MVDKINNVNFRGIRNYSSHTPKLRTYSEGYFMKKSPLAKDYMPAQNLAKRIFTLFGKISKLK